MSKVLCVLMIAILFLSTGCAYMNMQTPMDRDFERTKVGSKEGRASMHSVLWLVGWGNSGSHAAAVNGELTQINYADIEVLSILFGVYMRTTTVVYGE